MEVSSHALSQSRVAGVSFDAACVTNVSRDHLDYHATIQDYRLTKSKLFEHLSPEGFAVINADDPIAAGYLSRVDGPALTVGIRTAAEITAAPLEEFSSEQTFLLTAGSETIPVRTLMIGRASRLQLLVGGGRGAWPTASTCPRWSAAWRRSSACRGGCNGSSAASPSACSSISPIRPTP